MAMDAVVKKGRELEAQAQAQTRANPAELLSRIEQLEEAARAIGDKIAGLSRVIQPGKTPAKIPETLARGLEPARLYQELLVMAIRMRLNGNASWLTQPAQLKSVVTTSVRAAGELMEFVYESCENAPTT